MPLEDQIAEFLECRTFGVVGASTDRRKYGNKVLRCYQQHGRDVVPVNPNAKTVEGLPAVSSLSQASGIDAISIITPSPVTELVVQEAIKLGIRHIWMQPGAESDSAVKHAIDAGANVIHGGPCLLVVLG